MITFLSAILLSGTWLVGPDIDPEIAQCLAGQNKCEFVPQWGISFKKEVKQVVETPIYSEPTYYEMPRSYRTYRYGSCPSCVR